MKIIIAVTQFIAFFFEALFITMLLTGCRHRRSTAAPKTPVLVQQPKVPPSEQAGSDKNEANQSASPPKNNTPPAAPTPKPESPSASACCDLSTSSKPLPSPSSITDEIFLPIGRIISCSELPSAVTPLSQRKQVGVPQATTPLNFTEARLTPVRSQILVPDIAEGNQ